MLSMSQVSFKVVPDPDESSMRMSRMGILVGSPLKRGK